MVTKFQVGDQFELAGQPGDFGIHPNEWGKTHTVLVIDCFIHGCQRYRFVATVKSHRGWNWYVQEYQMKPAGGPW